MNVKRIWWTVLPCLLLAACGEQASNIASPDPEQPKSSVQERANADYRPGFGASDLPPKGRPFVLPAGVSIVEPIPGINRFEFEKCRNEEDGDKAPPENGSGDSVQLCIEFRNTTGKPVSIEFPPGLIMESEITDTQHGLLIQRASIVVPAKAQYFSLLYLYCLNASRGQSGPDSRFRIGPVTQEKDFLEFFDLIKNKRLPIKILEDDRSAKLQVIVGHLASDKGLSDDDRAFIASLPDK